MHHVGMASSTTPPGWPDGVLAPGATLWERSALNWLLDQCPPDYRGYAVLTRHPLALVHLAAVHVEASMQATKRARATARADLSQVLPPPVLTELLEALDAEQARLLSVQRGIGLLGEALRGRRFIPRL